MEIVSCPILEIMEGAVVVGDRVRMSSVTKSPIKAGMNLSEFGKSEGISGFKGADSIGFGVVDSILCF
jgi:hypothetical protein